MHSSCLRFYVLTSKGLVILISFGHSSEWGAAPSGGSSHLQTVPLSVDACENRMCNSRERSHHLMIGRVHVCTWFEEAFLDEYPIRRYQNTADHPRKIIQPAFS